MKRFSKLSNSKFILSLLLSIVMLLGFVNPVVLAEGEEAAATTVEILSFNDFHGNVAESGKNPGMAKLVGYIKERQASNPNTIVVSAGDNYQGTAISNLTYGKPVSEMLKAMGVVASAVGNHEFDWGIDKAPTWTKEGGFDFLASNIYDTETGEPVDWAKPYKIVEKGGIKIAFIGLAHPDTPTLAKQEYTQGLEFRDPVALATEWVNFLKDGKAEEGVPDLIIALTHIDSEQDFETGEITGKAVDLTQVEGLDAIISSHSHKSVAGEVNDVPIVQAYYNGRTIGVLTVKLDENNEVVDVEASLDPIYERVSELPVDEEAAAILEKYNTELDPILGEVIGEAAGKFDHETDNVTLLGKWVCEVMLENTDAEIAITNGGGLRRSLEAGPITMGDMYEIMPFDNTLVTLEITGADVKKAIDHGILNPEVRDGQFVGLIVEYDRNAEFENRVTKITLPDGTPLDMEAYYKVVINDFMYPNGDKYDFSRAQNVVNTYIPVRDVLVEAIKEAEVITPEEVDYLIEVQPTEEVEETVAEEVYVVKPGDVLWRIAEKFGTTWEKLADYNKLKNPHLIFPNQEILIPAQ